MAVGQEDAMQCLVDVHVDADGDRADDVEMETDDEIFNEVLSDEGDTADADDDLPLLEV